MKQKYIIKYQHSLPHFSFEMECDYASNDIGMISQAGWRANITWPVKDSFM